MQADRFDAWTFGLTSGAIAVLMTYVSGDRQFAPAAGIPLTAGGVCLVASLLVGLASFFPQTNLERLVSRRLGTLQPFANLSFYGQATTHAPGYADVASPTVGGLQLELAEQRVAGSRIPLLKLRLFTAAVILFAVGVLVSVVGVFIQSLT